MNKNLQIGAKLWQIAESQHYRKKDFAQKIGISRQTLDKWIAGNPVPDVEYIQKMCDLLNIEITDLFNGKLNVNKVSHETLNENLTSVKQSDFSERSTNTSSNGAHFLGHTMLVPLVNQYAYAGYMSGFSDPEYIDDLPKVPFEVDREGRGNYMCFEVRGDSMDDGTYDSLRPGVRVLAREIQRQHWQNRLHTHRYKKFVIVHRTEGILIKQITKHDVAANSITIHSLNSEFEDQVLNLDDVSQIFNVVKRQIDE